MKLIVNDRIQLSDIRPSDKSALIEQLNDKDIYDRTLRIPHPYTESDADRWLELVTKNTKEHGQPVTWSIRNDADCLIGCIGFEGLAIGKRHRAEIGYWLAKPYWGQGIMTAVVGKVCAFAFQEWGLAKITAHVFSFNAASARVLEKCGFVQEGYLSCHFEKVGRLIDARPYGLVHQSGSR
jgi:RimJ/RimL family protein N-acetyltransferase